MKRAVDIVTSSVERKGHGAGIGVDCEGLMLGKGPGRENERQNNENQMREGLHRSSSPGCIESFLVMVGCARCCDSQRLMEAMSRSLRYSWPGISVPGMPYLAISAMRSKRDETESEREMRVRGPATRSEGSFLKLDCHSIRV